MKNILAEYFFKDLPGYFARKIFSGDNFILNVLPETFCVVIVIIMIILYYDYYYYYCYHYYNYYYYYFHYYYDYFYLFFIIFISASL